MGSVYSTYTDEQLLELLGHDDEQAFREIYCRYCEQLSQNAIKLTASYDDANDIVQEIFISLWKNRSRLAITGSLAAYLHASARFGSFRVLQRADRHHERLRDLARYLAGNVSENSLLETKEIEQQVRQIVNTMPERMRAVYAMSRDQQMSHREIGLQLNISEETSRKQIKNALRIIRHRLNIVSSLFLFF